MNFRDLGIRSSYDSDEDDILNCFYIPALSCSISYRRLSGFFNSASLALAARGIAGLVQKRGKMELVCGAELSKEDVKAIMEGKERPDKVIERSTINELEGLEDIENEFIKDHVKALGWMIANSYLDIRIAIVKDISRIPLERAQAIQSGIYHQKVGILHDEDGNTISFSGSDNETVSGWKSNIEEFKVFRSWINQEQIYLDSDIKRFNKFWNGWAIRTDVFDVPTAVREKLIKLAPRKIETLMLEKYQKSTKKPEIRLFQHQNEAVEKWIAKKKRCLWEMATGTGKTFAALECIKRLKKDDECAVIVIVCPYNHLITQWIKNIKDYGLDVEKIVADSSNTSWKRTAADFIRDQNNQTRDEPLVILTTYDTFRANDFLERIRLSKGKVFLIADEVHHISSKVTKRGLIEKYDYRLGLSATPSRWLDPEGTEDILDFFGAREEKDKYSFPLEKAINTINPVTGQTFLSPYDYLTHFIELTEDEFDDYVRKTKDIAKMYFASRKNEDKIKSYNLLLERRQSIIRNAERKSLIFEEILDEETEIKDYLIYCSPEQIENVQGILNKRGIIQHKFTMNEGTEAEDRYEGLSERDHILKKFAEGTYQALVAMRILDEGVDIPHVRTGIILASTGNPRQYIQRRGRLLRRFPNKEKAIIHDIIVLPCIEGEISEELIKIEKQIFLKELRRYEEFARSALNRIECMENIYEVKKRYNIY